MEDQLVKRDGGILQRERKQKREGVVASKVERQRYRAQHSVS